VLAHEGVRIGGADILVGGDITGQRVVELRIADRWADLRVLARGEIDRSHRCSSRFRRNASNTSSSVFSAASWIRR
jgi:hypothetical protein